MSLIVAKFGGTSVKDAQAILRSANVAISTKANVIAVSATAGTTNLFANLIAIADSGSASVSESVQKIFTQLRDNHLQIASDLLATGEVSGKIISLIDDARSTFLNLLMAEEKYKKAYQDELYSYGERISSVLMTHAMKSLGIDTVKVDATNFIKTDSHFLNASAQIDKIKKMSEFFLRAHLNEGKTIVTQGFIGSNEVGQTTTLGRGGSDYSAALIAEALQANALYIWTDVNGIYTVDPRINKNARHINELTYQEAAELASFGAKVLHPSCLLPAMRGDFPIFVGSSLDHEQPGTWVKGQSAATPAIRALAKRSNQKLMTLSSVKMIGTHGFLANIFTTLAKYKVNVDLVTTSECSVALTLDGNNNGCGGEFMFDQQMIDELSQFCHVEIEDNLTLVALIGNNMHTAAGLGTVAFSSLGEFNIRCVSHGASSHNLCFLVASQNADDILNRLHQRFIENNFGQIQQEPAHEVFS